MDRKIKETLFIYSVVFVNFSYQRVSRRIFVKREKCEYPHPNTPDFLLCLGYLIVDFLKMTFFPLVEFQLIKKNPLKFTNG